MDYLTLSDRGETMMSKMKKDTISNKRMFKLTIYINALLFAYIVLMTLFVIFLREQLEIRQMIMFLSIYSGLYLMNLIILIWLSKKIGLYINNVSQISDAFLDFDPITGLDKRKTIREYVNQTIFIHQKKAALCLFQLDDYKEISIIKSQEMADEMMRELARRLTEKTNDQNILFSFSENEIGYIITEYNNLDDIKETISEVISYFKSSKVVKSIKPDTLVGAGISVYPKDSLELDGLLRKCELSLYRTKLTSEKQTIFYDEKMTDEVVYDVEITEQLSKAVEDDEIHLKFQPIVDMNHEIYGFESLARWTSPVVGDVSPDIFINSAEKNYMIVPLGNHILKKSCEAQVALKERFNREFMMSVNVSLIQLLQPGFLNVVKEVIKDTKINTDFLTLELTESIFIDSTFDLNKKLKDLHELGIKLSIDDFGTGYSSMTYLQKIDFDLLKIDKSFVDGMIPYKKDKEIIKSIIELASNLKMEVVVEGVENSKQLEYLNSIS
ncbi:MAG: GGDEF domain-containing phosphodiesterase, partial [Tenericutes bacterium]|nr:GGDEF domain-containing phosphodiesterase [Mycoplasmatota bacterium]